MLRWIKRQLDKIPSSPGLIRSGKWYIIYNDGQRSSKLTYDIARQYADHFGGKVYHITDKVENNANT